MSCVRTCTCSFRFLSSPALGTSSPWLTLLPVLLLWAGSSMQQGTLGHMDSQSQQPAYSKATSRRYSRNMLDVGSDAQPPVQVSKGTDKAQGICACCVSASWQGCTYWYSCVCARVCSQQVLTYMAIFSFVGRKAHSTVHDIGARVDQFENFELFEKFKLP
eukprot:scaffold7289_cov25-Tisochrysis_lutea.AAC.1